MFRQCAVFLLGLVAWSGLALGQERAASEQKLAELLPREREVALALSAAPEHLREGATVYVLERTGYVKVREGSNGFSCLVVRDHPQELAPICHDPEGSRTVVPRLLRAAELRAQGRSEEEIRQEINDGLRTGMYRLPQRVGIAYMLSPEAKAFVPELSRAVVLKPHVMLYAPYLRNEDIGALPPKPGEFPDYPFVILEGQFNAYIVMAVPDNDRPVPPVKPDPVLDQFKFESPDDPPPLLPREREIALALSAAPSRVAEKATVLVLERNGYVKARQGTNGFTCLVERDHPRSLYPICYDAEGTETMLPVSLRMAQLQRQGKKKEEIDRDIAEGYRTGRFRAPRPPGVAYMFSTEGRFPDPTSSRVTGWAPHAMFYAPYLRSADIGALGEGQMVRRLPTVLNEGRPDAYIIVTARGGSERAGNREDAAAFEPDLRSGRADCATVCSRRGKGPSPGMARQSLRAARTPLGSSSCRLGLGHLAGRAALPGSAAANELPRVV